tara:strand:- start:2858 stop:3757 length:900 start_codon:yes stop_codon:yes gene_type:complete
MKASTYSSQNSEERGVLEQYILPFLNISSQFPLYPGKNYATIEAALLGWTEQELEQARANLQENAKQAALELLKEDEIVDQLDALPFDGEECIAILGDSISLDAQGWVYILSHLIDIGTEQTNLKWINSSQAYDTTMDALRRLDRDILGHNPDWVIIALGTFDAQRLTIYPDRTLIPLSDTWENIQAIQDVLDQILEHPPLWVSPAAVIMDLLTEHALYDFYIQPEDLRAVQDIVTGKIGGIVDPRAERMGVDGPRAWHYIPDGLHHSLTGHMQTVREVIKTLVEIDQKGVANIMDEDA